MFDEVNAESVPLLVEIDFKRGKPLKVYADGSRNYTRNEEYEEPTDFNGIFSQLNACRHYFFIQELKEHPVLFRLYAWREFIVTPLRRPKMKMHALAPNLYVPEHNTDPDPLRAKLSRAARFYWRHLFAQTRRTSAGRGDTNLP